MIPRRPVCLDCKHGFVHERTFLCERRMPPQHDPLATPKEIAKYGGKPA